MIELIDNLARLVNGRGGTALHDVARMADLTKIVKDLDMLGYHLQQANDLKQLHLHRLVQHWQQTGQTNYRIHQLLTALHWWADKLERGHLFRFEEVTKGLYKIPTQFANPAWSLSKESTLPDKRMQGALMLMEAFGMRLREALVFPLTRALPYQKEISVVLGTPSGQPIRTLPILNSTQRNLLQHFGNKTSFTRLLPNHLSLNDYEYDIEQALIAERFLPVQGLRISYAQQRYREQMPHECPFAGGSKTAFLSPDLRKRDHNAREKISAELGLENHETITEYLGE